jgi:hypothetical protein
MEWTRFEVRLWWAFMSHAYIQVRPHCMQLCAVHVCMSVCTMIACMYVCQSTCVSSCIYAHGLFFLSLLQFMHKENVSWCVETVTVTYIYAMVHLSYMSHTGWDWCRDCCAIQQSLHTAYNIYILPISGICHGRANVLPVQQGKFPCLPQSCAECTDSSS